MVKNPPANAGDARDAGSIPGSERSPGGGKSYPLQYPVASLVAQRVRRAACNAGDLGLTAGLGRSSGEGNGNPLQDSCMDNSVDGGAW